MQGLSEATFPRVSRVEAKKKQRQYEEAARSKDADPSIYGQLAHVYKQLSMGRTVISLTKAMEVAGVRDNGLPVLAVGNADAKWVWFVWDAGMIRDDPYGCCWEHPGVAFVSDHAINPGWNIRNPKGEKRGGTIRFLRTFFPVRPEGNPRARVPVIPPEHRPKGRLWNYHILWEANWETAPRDPVLLRRISREHFVVMAQWDLTEVERLVLEMAAFGGE